MEVTTMSRPSKRAKAPGSTTQVAHCVVDGCSAELSRCREYHRRHKVCEAHSKTPRVTVCGLEQRFCQQCSRFHSLAEFDEGKRSCRKRLDVHNRRRRKPQLESLTRNHGILFSSQQGARLLSFSNPETFNEKRAGILNADKDLNSYPKKPDQDYILGQNSSYESPSHNYKAANKFQVFESTKCVLPEMSTRHPLHDPTEVSTQPRHGLDCPTANTNCSPKIVSDGFDSNRALSLLSSGSAVTRDICFDHLVQPGDSSMYHHLPQPSAQHFNRQDQFLFSESKPTDYATLTESSQDGNLRFQEMFQNGRPELTTSGSQQTVTFMWE